MSRLLSGGAWALGGRIGSAASALLVNALLARLLTPNELGAYFLTLTLVLASVIIGQLGLNDIVVRLIAESLAVGQAARALQAIRIARSIVLVASTAVGLILYFGLGQWLAQNVFGSQLVLSVIGLAALWVLLLALQTLFAEIFRGFHDIRLAVIFGGLVRNLLLALFCAALWFVRGSADLPQIIILILIALLTSNLIASRFLRQKFVMLRGQIVAALATATQTPNTLPELFPSMLSHHEMVQETWPFLFNRLMIFIFTQTNLWVMGAFRPENEVALFGAAVYLVTLVSIPLSVVGAVVPPLIAELYTQGKRAQLQKTLRTITTLAGVPSFLALLLFMFFGQPILGLVYGEYYRSAALLLAILSAGKAINVWTGPCEAALNMTGHQRVMMLISICYGALSIVGSIWAVKAYGMVGVATVTALAVVLQNLTTLFFAKRQTGIWTHATVRVNPKPLWAAYQRG